MQQEEDDGEDLCGFINGGGAGGRGGGGGGSESVDGDSLDQRWRDMEGQARSRLPTSHLGSGDSINRIMSQEVAQPRARAHAV